MSRIARILVGFGITFIGSVVATVVAAQSPLQVKPLVAYLNEHDWVALSIPDSKMRPGSVIKVKNLNNFIEVRWLGDIRDCGISDSDLGVTRDKYPAIGIGENFAVKASIGASILSLFGFNADAD